LPKLLYVGLCSHHQYKRLLFGSTRDITTTAMPGYLHYVTPVEKLHWGRHTEVRCLIVMQRQAVWLIGLTRPLVTTLNQVILMFEIYWLEYKTALQKIGNNLGKRFRQLELYYLH